MPSAWQDKRDGRGSGDRALTLACRWPALVEPGSGRDADLPGPVGTAKSERIVVPPYSPGGRASRHGLAGADDPKSATAGAPSVAPRPAGSQLRSRGRASEADHQVVDGLLEAILAARVALNGPVRGLGASSMTRTVTR
jgi:hypothetical protein